MGRIRDPLAADSLLNGSLPPMPLALIEQGRCSTHPEPDLWSSRALAERRRAVRLCECCPVLTICAAWAAALPLRYRAGIILAAQMPLSEHAQAAAQRAQAAAG